MKIVKFYGGLGNQMFQYALLVALRSIRNEDVLMDTSLYSSYGLHNGFELSKVLNITANTASKDQINSLSWYTTNYKIARLIHYILPHKKTEFVEHTFGQYYPEALIFDCDKSYDGYWQHWEYFNNLRDEILKEFSLKIPLDKANVDTINSLLVSDRSVSVHVRRGDYLKSKLYKGICEKDYYRAAVYKAKEIVGDKAHFYFFSNDIDWCLKNLSDLIDSLHFHTVDCNKGANSYKDMVLMSGCRVNIIANSSFSWWGAYLNQRDDKQVIAPKVWINKKMPNPIQMPEWIKL